MEPEVYFTISAIVIIISFFFLGMFRDKILGRDPYMDDDWVSIVFGILILGLGWILVLPFLAMAGLGAAAFKSGSFLTRRKK